ncbi:Putative Flp pilus-assembly TadE/G-like [Peptoclostridium litorale DSM 5388]|uniref:Flp pilus assembly protein TadD n=1 Tax=Peptoclostridium litorale DSM 5388 TaxID=1121324 RepID=A0A069RHP3_PEPLI|nr:pilus assembly protein TadG-related protein [Peptoclostridium litorale]KDR93787.1 Flp pilus assembly protein TadD [Peptoclostridium litorale DSM 5388]SIN85851.1 Putative Flp pilus-assembly TadE/G-like [Peptoclostridium litorale DSM 5388]
MLTIIKNNRGSTIIFISLTLSIMLMFVSFAVDIGLLVYNKSKLQNAVDAASLAAAQEIPEDTSSAIDIAKQYIASNGFDLNELAYSIDFEEDNCKVIVSASYNMDFLFASIIGVNSSGISAKASAINAPAEQVLGEARPFALKWDPVDDKGKFKPGETYTLKYSSKTKGGNPELGPGNFGAVQINKKPDGKFESGAKVYEDTIVKGNSTKLKIGDTIYTETGNMVGPTENGMERLFENEGTPVTIYIPLVESLDMNGHKPLNITGFAAFKVSEANFSEEEEGEGKDKVKTETAEIKGAFVEFTTLGTGGTSLEDHGLRVINLVK